MVMKMEAGAGSRRKRVRGVLKNQVFLCQGFCFQRGMDEWEKQARLRAWRCVDVSQASVELERVGGGSVGIGLWSPKSHLAKGQCGKQLPLLRRRSWPVGYHQPILDGLACSFRRWLRRSGRREIF